MPSEGFVSDIFSAGVYEHRIECASPNHFQIHLDSQAADGECVVVRDLVLLALDPASSAGLDRRRGFARQRALSPHHGPLDWQRPCYRHGGIFVTHLYAPSTMLIRPRLTGS